MEPYYDRDGVSVYQGDCLVVLSGLPAVSVNCCVTSPPYWGLRDYGHGAQIGLESTPEEYVAKMVAVFREVRRVLRDDGTLWLNIGDSYNNYRPMSKNDDRAHSFGGDRNVERGLPDNNIGTKRGTKQAGLKEKDLVGIPWRVAFALQADGWYLRQDLIWHKPNPMPESVRDRCTKAHEYIFLLSKSKKYYYDHEAIKEPAVCGSNGSEFHTGKTGEHQLGRASRKPRSSGNRSHKHTEAYDNGDERHRTKAGLVAMGDEVRDTRNKRSVWTVATKSYKGAHFATFPPKLIEPCILAGCPEGGVVLDPFAGSGTTAQVSWENGRKFVGCELNPEYIELIKARLA